MVACLSKVEKKSRFYKNNSLETFSEFLRIEKSKGKKKPIVILLFENYIEKQDELQSEKYFSIFHKAYKKDSRTIESMLARILDLPSVKSNKVKFLNYVKQINNGKFKVSKKLANKIKVNALNLQFKK